MKKRKQLFKYYLQECKNIWKRILEKRKLITGIFKIIVGIIKTIVGITKTIVNKFISFLLNAVVVLYACGDGLLGLFFLLTQKQK